MRSRVSYPTMYFVDVIRKTLDRVNGRFVESGHTTLYSRIAANINDVKRFDADQLAQPSGAGIRAENQYQVGLGGLTIPNRVLRGDYIRVYWGTYPNVYSDPAIPRNYSPQLILNDGVDHKLTWSQNGWTSETYSILYVDEPYESGWQIFFQGSKIADLGSVFDSPRLDCSLPQGIRLVRLTAQPLDLKVTQVNHKMDDTGKWHHTAIVCEYSDTDGGVKL